MRVYRAPVPIDIFDAERFAQQIGLAGVTPASAEAGIWFSRQAIVRAAEPGRLRSWQSTRPGVRRVAAPCTRERKRTRRSDRDKAQAGGASVCTAESKKQPPHRPVARLVVGDGELRVCVKRAGKRCTKAQCSLNSPGSHESMSWPSRGRGVTLTPPRRL